MAQSPPWGAEVGMGRSDLPETKAACGSHSATQRGPPVLPGDRGILSRPGSPTTPEKSRRSQQHQASSPGVTASRHPRTMKQLVSGEQPPSRHQEDSLRGVTCTLHLGQAPWPRTTWEGGREGTANTRPLET